MSDEVKLLPCPFCGGQAGRAHDITLAWIECGNCGAQGASWSRYREEKAPQAWNTRATRPPIGTDEVVERRVHDLIEAARMYEASCRLGGKDQALASRKLDQAKSAAIAAMKDAASD